MKILVISDVHGNAEALAAVLSKEKDADAALFLGDALLSGPQPNETVSLLKHLPGIFIAGPHDLDILEPERFADWPAEWRAWSQWICDTLAPEGRDFLRALKPEGEYELDGLRLYLTHGAAPEYPAPVFSEPSNGLKADSVNGRKGPPQPQQREPEERPRHILPDSPDELVTTLARNNDSPLVLFGHSHIQFKKIISGQEFFNPGSVGQNRCGKRLACYGLLDGGVLRHRQADYDPAPWLEAMDGITALDAFPDFRENIKKGLLSGYGIGRQEPWTRLAKEGYC